MIGKYLDLADEYVQKFKPIIERRTRVKLDDLLTAKDICVKPNYVDDSYPNTEMLVHHDCPDSIFVNQNMYEEDETPIRSIPTAVAHELSHLTHSKIVDEKSWKKLWKKKSFMEGFAEYMSLDHLIDIYDGQVVNEAIKERGVVSCYLNDFPKDDVPFERGYKFFRKVLSVIGEDKVFEVAKALPISEAEVKMPLLYLLRKYPAKGIRNIPKFLTRGIKTKILKKRNGYAKFDFPLSKKGSGKGKVFKALPV